MPGITVTSSGDFKKTNRFLSLMLRKEYLKTAERLARDGVSALAAATPVDTGKTAQSWEYEMKDLGGGRVEIVWYNTNLTKTGESIALMLQYGHGTGTGGFVRGRDYINPTMKEVYNNLVDEAWRVVCNS